MKRPGCGGKVLAKRFYALCEMNFDFLALCMQLDEINVVLTSFSKNKEAAMEVNSFWDAC